MAIFSESLKSLQGAGGACCLVWYLRVRTMRFKVQGGSLRNFSEGDNIRVIRPKTFRQVQKRGPIQTLVQHPTVRSDKATGSVRYNIHGSTLLTPYCIT
jgi:hypothetical protein